MFLCRFGHYWQYTFNLLFSFLRSLLHFFFSKESLSVLAARLVPSNLRIYLFMGSRKLNLNSFIVLTEIIKYCPRSTYLEFIFYEFTYCVAVILLTDFFFSIAGMHSPIHSLYSSSRHIFSIAKVLYQIQHPRSPAERSRNAEMHNQ